MPASSLDRTCADLVCVARAQEDGIGMYIATFLAYQVLGIALMFLARFLIDKIVLRDTDTAKDIVEDMNISVACVEGAAVIGCTVLISTSASGDGPSLDLGQDLGATILYFALGQLLLIGQLLLLNQSSADKAKYTAAEKWATQLQTLQQAVLTKLA